MAFTLNWDAEGDRLYETGVDRGVLYVKNSDGTYENGVVWNGLTSVSESPSGGEPNAIYADNIKYLNLLSVEELGLSIEAYTYPEEFAACDGSASPVAGMYVGQQIRKHFGFCYRTLIGNDQDSNDHGYKIHIVYDCLASPSEKAYSTVNDSPEAITFSWEVTTNPVTINDSLKPAACITVDSTKTTSAKLAALEELLYGKTGQSATQATLPTPAQVIAALT